MKFLVFLTFFLLTGTFLYGQNLIGYSGKQIRKYMKENHNEMNLEKVTNTRFKYLKYTANNDDQTMLFFLNSDSICMSINLICDQGIKAERFKEFDSVYKKSSENGWIDERNGKRYLIEFREEKWSCIFTMKLIK
jgi:hypothetical protein